MAIDLENKADMDEIRKHKGLPVAGYREQSQDNIDLVNSHKIWEEQMLRHLDMLMKRHDLNPRWLSIARTHFEQGYMALNRAVFQPERLNIKE